jgi:hypothetical protein
MIDACSQDVVEDQTDVAVAELFYLQNVARVGRLHKSTEVAGGTHAFIFIVLFLFVLLGPLLVPGIDA